MLYGLVLISWTQRLIRLSVNAMKKNYRIAPKVREQILRRIKEEGLSVEAAAKDAGVHNTTIYGWLGKGVRGNLTIGELARLKRQNEELPALVGELTLKASQTQCHYYFIAFQISGS